MQEVDFGESIENIYGEKYFSLVNGELFKTSSSSTVFSRYFKEQFKKENTLYIICGSDSGLLPFYLAKKFKKDRKGRKFIFIDYKQAFSEVDTSTLPNWVECYDDSFSLPVLAQLELEYVTSNAIELVKSIAVIDAENESIYYLLWKDIKKEYQGFMFVDKVNSATRSFVDAQLLNLHSNINPIKSLQGFLEGKTVVLLGGGPSLDLSIEWIKNNRNKFVLFAAGRISRFLLQKEVQPDFVVSVDPHDISFDNSKQMMHFDSKTILLNCFHINPKILNQWPNNSVYFGNSFPWNSSEENSSSPGPTVIHSALHQIVFMKAKKVYLSGVEMCFQQEKTHFSGSAENEAGKFALQKDLPTVKTYSGEIADTSQAFAMGVDTLENLVNSYVEIGRDTQIYNTSPFAAKVEGIPFKDLSEIVLEEQSDLPEMLLNLNESLKLPISSRYAHQEKVLSILEGKNELLKKVSRTAKKGLKKVADYKKRPESKGISRGLVKLQKQLIKQLGDLGEVIYHYGMNYFEDAFRPIDDEDNMSEEEIAFTVDSFFKGMIKSIDDFLLQLEKAIKVCQFRKKEYQELSKPEDLINGWLERFELGRYLIWENDHPEAKRSFEDEKALKFSKDTFRSTLDQTDTLQAKELQDKSVSPIVLYQRAEEAFEEKDVSELKDILLQAEKITTDEKHCFICLLKGMVFDVNNEIDLASGEYKKISFQHFRLFVLKRLLNFSLSKQEHEEVLINLEGLCGFSVDYMIIYADYLAMLGQLDLSQKVLEQYIEINPSDFVALLKLADVCLKRGCNSDALSVLRYAEKIDPSNPQLIKMIGDFKSL